MTIDSIIKFAEKMDLSTEARDELIKMSILDDNTNNKQDKHTFSCNDCNGSLTDIVNCLRNGNNPSMCIKVMYTEYTGLKNSQWPR